MNTSWFLRKIDLETDESGTWVLTYEYSMELPENRRQNSIMTMQSSDGITWDSPTPIAESTFPQDVIVESEVHPSLATRRNGTWITAWQSPGDMPNNEYDTDIKISTSRNGGQDWTEPAKIDPNNVPPWGGFLDIQFAHNEQGTWMVVGRRSARPGLEADYAQVSQDNGRSWTEPIPLPVTIDEDIGLTGLVHAHGNTWYTYYSDTLVLRTDDDGSTWQLMGHIQTGSQITVKNISLDSNPIGTTIASWPFGPASRGGSPPARPIPMYRSIDGAQTWTHLDNFPLQNTDRAPRTDIAGNDFGDWAVAIATNRNEISIALSRDDGETFLHTHTLTTEDIELTDSEGEAMVGDHSITDVTIANDGGENWLLASLIWLSTPISGRVGIPTPPSFTFTPFLVVSRSTDNGETWSSPVTLQQIRKYLDGNFSEGITSILKANSNGNQQWLIEWVNTHSAYEGGRPDPQMFVFSNDNGLTWSDSTYTVMVGTITRTWDDGAQFATVGDITGRWMSVWPDFNRGVTLLNSFQVSPEEIPDPCDDGDIFVDQLTTLQSRFNLDGDMDHDGLPDRASLKLLKAVTCQALIYTNYTYQSNFSSFTNELDFTDLLSHDRVIPALMSIGSDMQTALREGLAKSEIFLDRDYTIVDCDTPGDCLSFPSDDTRSTNEPLTGDGDIDNDGITNLQEYNNVISRGGSIDDFVLFALDAAQDGTEFVRSSGGGGGGGCLIAAAAYGTPLADDLNAIREFRNNSLLSNPLGTALSDTYYRLSAWAMPSVSQSPTTLAAARQGLSSVWLLWQYKLYLGLIFLTATAFWARQRHKTPGI